MALGLGSKETVLNDKLLSEADRPSKNGFQILDQVVFKLEKISGIEP